MARVAKMTIMVDMAATSQVLQIRTTGSRGTTNLNTVNVNQGFVGHSPIDTAPNFWHDVLTKAATTF